MHASITCKMSEVEMLCRMASSIVDQVKLEVIDGEGIKFTAVDPAHVAMVAVDFRNASAECGAANRYDFIVGIDRLKDMVKAVDAPGLDVHIQFEKPKDAKRGHCTVSTKAWKSRFELEDAVGFYEAKWPNLKFTAHAKLRLGEFYIALRLAAHVSDHIELTAKGGKLTMRASSDRLNADMGSSMEHQFEAKASGEGRALYSLDYLESALREHDLAADMELEFGDDMPLGYAFKVGAHDDPAFDVKFLLAPRIESSR